MRLKPALEGALLEHMQKLYLEAFPQIERKPFDVLLKKRDEGIAELLAIEGDGGEFEGLAITVLYEDMVLLDYFAIEDSWRGQGVGSEALRLLQSYYGGRRLMLEIERTDVEADNIGQRLKRKAFYLRNEMTVMPFLVNVFGTEMELLTHESQVTYEEYHKLYEVFGEEFARTVTYVGSREDG